MLLKGSQIPAMKPEPAMPTLTAEYLPNMKRINSGEGALGSNNGIINK
ncbi:MAG: hypothetical protein R3F31_03560 [Verrucomicrobiales bacterium]